MKSIVLVIAFFFLLAHAIDSEELLEDDPLPSSGASDASNITLSAASAAVSADPTLNVTIAPADTSSSSASPSDSSSTSASSAAASDSTSAASTASESASSTAASSDASSTAPSNDSSSLSTQSSDSSSVSTAVSTDSSSTSAPLSTASASADSSTTLGNDVANDAVSNVTVSAPVDANVTVAVDAANASTSAAPSDSSSTTAASTDAPDAATKPQPVVPALPVLPTIKDETPSIFVAKGVYTKTSANEKACKQNQDCYNLREPDEWCPLPDQAKYGDKGCFCDHVRNVCTIQRQSEKGEEFSDCAEKSTSACAGLKPVVRIQQQPKPKTKRH